MHDGIDMLDVSQNNKFFSFLDERYYKDRPVARWKDHLN